MANYLIHFDGSCWPNPGGVAAYGYTVDKDGVEIAAVAGLVPSTLVPTSNNVAEFYALYAALMTLPIQLGDQIEVRGDSQLVINIMSGKWRANNDKLYWESYRKTALEQNRISTVMNDSINYAWIPREANAHCDDLSKEINNAAR